MASMNRNLRSPAWTLASVWATQPSYCSALTSGYACMANKQLSLVPFACRSASLPPFHPSMPYDPPPDIVLSNQHLVYRLLLAGKTQMRQKRHKGQQVRSTHTRTQKNLPQKTWKEQTLNVGPSNVWCMNLMRRYFAVCRVFNVEKELSLGLWDPCMNTLVVVGLTDLVDHAGWRGDVLDPLHGCLWHFVGPGHHCVSHDVGLIHGPVGHWDTEQRTITISVLNAGLDLIFTFSPVFFSHVYISCF